MARNLLVVCGGTGACLIGLQSELRLNAQLQVDVKNELKQADPNLPIYKQRLDPRITNTAQLLAWLPSRFEEGSASHRHATYLRDHYPNVLPIVDGCGRSPAIGGGLVLHSSVERNLRMVLNNMLTGQHEEAGVGTELVVWIFSSTAGGTGEGIHRAIAKLIMDLMRPSEIPLKIYFVRVGPGTYNSVDPQRVRLNTFFGLAADLAFNFQAQQEQNWASLYWFYMDLPDVGVGVPGEVRRAQLIEMMAKGIMLPEVNEDLLTILAGGAQSVLVRTGYWTLDMKDARRKYSEALLALEGKLASLIETDLAVPKREKDEKDLAFERGDLASIPRELGLEGRLGKNDGLQRLIRQREFRITEYTGSIGDRAWESWLARCRQSVDQLLSIAELRIDQAGATYRLPGGDPFELLRADFEEYDQEWFKAIDRAHRMSYWSSRLLPSLQSALRNSAKPIANALSHRGYNDQQKAQEIRPLLESFVLQLVQVEQLRDARTQAESELQTRLHHVRSMRTKVQDHSQSQSQSQRGTEGLIDVRDLDSGEDETWLARLALAMRSNAEFEEEVLRGAIGLTLKGLCTVLGVEDPPDYGKIKQELRTKHGADGLQSTWWLGEDIQAAQVYSYRVFPLLSKKIRRELGGEDGRIAYRHAENGTIGLSVMALDVAVLSQVGDARETPEFLTRPLVGWIQEQLRDIPDGWVDPARGRVTGKLQIAMAGVVGDPLFKELLSDVGLTDTEIEKLEEFYEMH